MGSRILMALISAVLIFDHASPYSEDEDEEFFVELKTGHLTIPVPYRPQEDYSHGGKPVPAIHEILLPEIGTNETSDSFVIPDEEDTTEDEPPQIQQGRGLGRKTPTTNDSGSMEVIQKVNPDDGANLEDLQHDTGQKGRMLAQMSVGGKYVPEPRDTDAQWGDACNPTGALEWDYCEKAKYPSKGRMVCATPDMNAKVNVGTCVCKFAKNGTYWKQLKYHPPTKLCRSPEGGVCYVKFPTDRTTDSGDPVYLKNITKAHDQCEDDSPIGAKNRSLLCSKPHPRRFQSYNAYHHYCLKKEDRLSLAGRLKVHFLLMITMFWISYFQ